MEFRTVLTNSHRRDSIKHSHRILMIGSCFSDNIGNRLRSAMMQVEINPFGTVYNPASILEEVKHIISGEEIKETDLFQANGMWNHFSFHSHFSRACKTAALSEMNARLIQAHNHLKQCNEVIITLGTAFVYRHKVQDMIVSNCHKLPAAEFARQMMSVTQVSECLDEMVRLLHDFAPQARVIFTVSPIRHVSDGLEQNQLSKSVLRVAVGEMVTRYPKCCEYFPAYEIMMDDLRDYRFYAADMVHPSDVAVEYIWNTFKATYFDDNTAQTASRCERISKRLAHRPMTDNREAIEKFNNETKKIITNLVKEYSYLCNIDHLKDYIAP